MRDYRIDNAKGVLIFLVVLGHFLESARGWDNPTLSFILTLIYQFHMPAFIFLAGLTAKSSRPGRRLATLIILLVGFQFLYLAPAVMLHGAYPNESPLEPRWILWFLMSMFWWVLMVPLILRTPAPLAVSLVVALVAGTLPWASGILSASRTLVFLPFFVAGLVHGRQLLARLPSFPARHLVACGIVASLGTLLYLKGIGVAWFSGYFRYELLDVDMVEGLATRLTLTVAAAVATLSLLTAMPAGNGLLARIGASSLSVYLLHGFVARNQLLERVLAQYGEGVTLALALLVSAALTWLLGRPFFDRMIRGTAERVLETVLRVVGRTGAERKSKGA